MSSLPPSAAPVFLVGAPASGTLLLLSSLSRAAGVWHAPPETTFPVGLPDTGEEAQTALAAALVDREGHHPAGEPGGGIAVAAGDHLSANIAFLAAAFPMARFVLVTRAAGDAVPGWRAVTTAGVDTTETRWVGLRDAVAAGVQALPADRWRIADHERFVANPRAELRELCAWLGVLYDQALLGPFEDLRRRTATRSGAPEPTTAPSGDAPPMSTTAAAAFSSASTASFPATLAAHASSLLISTYQTGKLISVREQDGGLNTHFRTFDKPMGIALAPDRFSLGTRTEIWDLRNMPAVAPKIAPSGTHDACYIPRNRHTTGDIAVHEMGFVAGELWFVATSFSCLATLDEHHSFVPRWRPPFVSELAPGDRCHLNGMSIVDGAVQYVTALGTGDGPGSWRSGKATGGVLIDVPSSEIVAAGLCMPHSPRWHDGELWVLQSGKGELCRIDRATGEAVTVVELPGFTRGLAFAGRTAFVGLSQIRESSTFGDLPLVHRLAERECGVWMVDLDRGAITGFLRFDDLVQEVFDVALLVGQRFPEIAEPGSTATALSFELP